MKGLSIKTKLTLLIFFIVLLSIALISGQAYRIAVKDMSNNAKANTRSYAKNISDIIQNRILGIKEKVIMAEMNESRFKTGSSSVVLERSPEIIAIVKYFFDTPYSQPQAQRFLINPIYSKKDKLNEKNLASVQSYVNFKSVFRNNEYLNISKTKVYPTDLMIYSFPIKATGVQGIYVFVALVAPDLVVNSIETNEKIKEERRGLDSSGKYINYLVDDKGRILFHPNKKELSKNIYNLSLFKDFFVSEVIVEKTSEYVDEDGKQVIGSIFKIRRSNIAVVSKILAKNVYVEAEKLKRIFFITSLFAFLLSIIIGLYFARTLSAPLIKLARVTGEIARGNFLVKIDVNSKDEIGDLAKSFGKMGQELHNREEELNSAHIALVQSEKMSAFGQISAGIAHEVKNPLTGILGHAQLTKERIAKLCSNQVPQDVGNSLEIIERETKRCKDIVENLMKFARQEKTEFIEEDISRVVRGAIGLVDHQLTINGVKIFSEIPDGFPRVVCNANQIEQVLMNIMMNAQHAMDKVKEKKIMVRLKQGQVGFARIEIEDVGSGMPEEVRKKIFEPFFTTKPAGQGTGLGLSVSFGIIRDHKGLLNVESEEGKGTTFIIELPYTDPAIVADETKLKHNLVHDGGEKKQEINLSSSVSQNETPSQGTYEPKKADDGGKSSLPKPTVEHKEKSTKSISAIPRPTIKSLGLDDTNEAPPSFNIASNKSPDYDLKSKELESRVESDRTVTQDAKIKVPRPKKRGQN
jgi:signal transduction histidine kinase